MTQVRKIVGRVIADVQAQIGQQHSRGCARGKLSIKGDLNPIDGLVEKEIALITQYIINPELPEPHPVSCVVDFLCERPVQDFTLTFTLKNNAELAERVFRRIASQLKEEGLVYKEGCEGKKDCLTATYTIFAPTREDGMNPESEASDTEIDVPAIEPTKKKGHARAKPYDRRNAPILSALRRRCLQRDM